VNFNLTKWLKHWRDYWLVKKSGLFNADYYLNHYPDAKRAGLDPIWHYMKFGWKEGKNPSPDFDTTYYLRTNKDVGLAKTNPLVHYIKCGKAEGRPPSQSIADELNSYKIWMEKYDILTSSDRAEIQSHSATFKYQPLISLLMPVSNNTPQQRMQEAIDSLFSQLYPHWELCIAADTSSDALIRQFLDAYSHQDPRVKVTYHETKGRVSTALNAALALCSGDFIGVLDHNGILREHALYLVINELNEYPHADIIYSDEDTMDDKGDRDDPFFKPDWNPDLFNSHNYLAHFTVYRASLVHQISGFRKEFESAQDWDLAMRLSETVPSSNIRHIPFVLYHNLTNDSSTTSFSNVSDEVQYEVLKSHFARINQNVEISFTEDALLRLRYPLPDPQPFVSVIIPTRNHLKLLKVCLDSIMEKTTYASYEVLIVNNQSDNPEILAYFESFKKDDKIVVLDYDHPFNFSAINNFAVHHSRGDVLVFMNNDIEVISPEWLDEMVSHAIRPDIGAVGALLYYDDNTIQHAGVILGAGGVAGHAYLNLNKKYLLHKKGAFMVRNYSAVTGACMAVEKRKFEEVGGFSEKHLPVTFNDIDFCLRLLEEGYRNLWTPYAEFYHHESASRGYDGGLEKRIRNKREQHYMIKKWGGILRNDPAYNPNFTLLRNAYSLSFPPRIKRPWKE